MLMRHFTTLACTAVMMVAGGSASAQNVGKFDIGPKAEEPGQQQQAFDDGTTQVQVDATNPTQPRAQATVGNQGTTRSVTPRTNPNVAQATRPLGNQDNRYEARRANYDRQQKGVTLEKALVKKLTKANDAQIELAKMIKGETDNQEVKQLASTIIEDHKALNKKLSDIDTKANKDGDNATNSNDRSPKVPDALCQIGEQACDNVLEMTKQMLSEKDGQDLDMAFLGQQCMAHTMMIAELKAIQSKGPESLQSFANSTINKLEKHLDKTKEIAGELKDKGARS